MTRSDVHASWEERLARHAARPAPRTAARLAALPIDLPRAAGEVVRIHNAASGRAFLATLAAVPLAAIAVATLFAFERLDLELRSGATWRDIRSRRPTTVSVAAWTTAADGGLDDDHVLRATFDVRVPEVAAVLGELLCLRATFVFHDAKDALFSLWALGLDPAFEQIYDTRIAAACLHLGEHPKGAATGRTGYEQIVADQAARDGREDVLSLDGQCREFGVTAPSQIAWDDTDRLVCTATAALELYAKQLPKVQRRGLVHHLETVEFPFAAANARIEWNGVYLAGSDREVLRLACQRAAQHFATQLRAAGVDPPGSVDAFLRAMGRAGLIDHFSMHGSPRVDDDRLEMIEPLHPAIRAFRLHRRYVRLAHEEWLADGMVGADGRVHPVHTQLGAATGRNTCSAPNLAGIGRVLRPVVTAPPGRAIVEFDYEQVEVGVAAAEHDDRELIAAYNSGDVYAAMAQRFYATKLTDEERALAPRDFKARRPDLRDAMKTFVLATLYGVQAPTLAARFAVPVAEAERQRERFLDLYPTLRQRMDESADFGAVRGHASIVTGLRRKRSTRGRPTQHERNALRNTPIQGGAAVVFKRAVILLDQAFRGTTTQIILPVHDAVVIECAITDVDAVCERAAALMGHALRAVYPKLDPRVSINKSDPSCWNKDGKSDSLRQFLADPSLTIDAIVATEPARIDVEPPSWVKNDADDATKTHVSTRDPILDAELLEAIDAGVFDPRERERLAGERDRWHEQFEANAAALEFEANLPRSDAEERARAMTLAALREEISGCGDVVLLGSSEGCGA